MGSPSAWNPADIILEDFIPVWGSVARAREMLPTEDPGNK